MVDSETRPKGRPRDPLIREKVLLAAQRVYLASGLQGFTFEAIAREAGVGKPALYRRWTSTDELMEDVLRSHALVPAEASSGGIREQLVEIAIATLRLSHSEAGAFALRVSSERGSGGVMFDRYFERFRSVIHSHNRSLVRAAIERGELTPDRDPDTIVLAITGAVLVGTLMALAPSPTADPQAAETYCGRVVDEVLGKRTAAS
ncbi:TetR/AcrR family transcriptional regulator [Microbacterium sp.]|uniref:TetR/AcrR family transcriptional regulator n=1 Tax=Microbacterium sp. TaxID=51671 RepID=UPI0025F8B661|nr:TetR/AcrR family transcriptional regulator [Microbacterium sp.]